MGGWILLHKKLKRWELYTEPNAMRLFIELLITANYKDQEWNGIIVRRGQKVTSIATLSKALNLSTKQIRVALRKLSDCGTITDFSTNQHRVITIMNYNDYQRVDPEDELTDEVPATAIGQAKGQTKGQAKSENKGKQKGKRDVQLDTPNYENEGKQKGKQNEPERASKRASKRATIKEVLKNSKEEREESARTIPEEIIQNVINLFGDVPSLAVDDLRIWLEEEQVDSSLINEALLIGKEKSAYSWQYIRNMVESAKHRGITSGAQLRTSQAERRPTNGYRKQVTKADADRLDQVIARAEEYRKQMEAMKCNV